MYWLSEGSVELVRIKHSPHVFRPTGSRKSRPSKLFLDNMDYITCTGSSQAALETDTESTDESEREFSSEWNTESESSNSSEQASECEPGNQSGPLACFSEPLYTGAKLTVLDSYLLLYQFFLRHFLSKKAFSELITLISVHLPETTLQLRLRGCWKVRNKICNLSVLYVCCFLFF